MKSASAIRRHMSAAVAPRTGAWIEMSQKMVTEQGSGVAPRTGAWIEISMMPSMTFIAPGRPPHGGVD